MKLTIAITPELRFRLAYAETLDIEVPEPALVVPEGWRLVPVEPTEEILRAIRSCVLVESCYRAMLAAAPKPEGAV